MENDCLGKVEEVIDNNFSRVGYDLFNLDDDSFIKFLENKQTEKMTRKIKIEGYTIDELLTVPQDDFDALIFNDDSLVFSVGSAEILGKFSVTDFKLTLELAQIDGGGEGALPLISRLAKRLAKDRNLVEIEWVVHAVHCKNPNLKLRRVLLKRGFEIQQIENVGEVYYLCENLD